MPATVLSGALVGVECVIVRVEVSVTSGLPSISVVGLPQSAVREGRERVRAALHNAGFRLPPKRITVNLSPADLKKEGSGFDLPIALGLLTAGGLLDRRATEDNAYFGELGLDGRVRSGRGAAAVAHACGREGVSRLFVSEDNAREAAAAAPGVEVLGVSTLADLVAHLDGSIRIPPTRVDVDRILGSKPEDAMDLADVRGQPSVKRALEIAAAGGHNLLLVGPPGSGKTMLARRLAGILPSLTAEEAFEVTTIHSVAGLLPADEALVRARPFRAPHHTVTRAGLVGGGSPTRPGEISLAHCGVLFLDELPEFSRGTLETLRQPLEDGWISIARASERVRFPARFTLVAAMNPCPCGHLGDSVRPCECDPVLVARYRSRISGPLRDRIDLHVGVPVPPFRVLDGDSPEETSALVRSRVERARSRQWSRMMTAPGAAHTAAGTVWNATLSPPAVRRWCRPDEAGRRLLEDGFHRLRLSPRGIHRVLKVARTVADLEAVEVIRDTHVAEALQYRLLDRERSS